MKIKTFSTDFLYTFGVQVVFNGIQHLVVFPWINRLSGPEITGRILACFSIVYIFSTSLGYGMNCVRLVEQRKGSGSNGDYLTLLTIGSIFLFFIVLISKRCGFDPQVNLIWFAILAILNMIRSYGEVDFRLKLHFSAYFIFYSLVSFGYLLGLLIYKVTNNWTFIFITGEILGLIILFYRKMIFIIEKPSNKLFYLGKAVFFLFLSSIMIQIIVSGDRLILKYFLGDHFVTVYSSLSLAAKVMNMLVLPLGTLLLSYLSAKTIPLTKKWLFRILALWSIFCLFSFCITYIISPIYVKLFYSNLFNEIQGLNVIVNAGLTIALIGYLFRIYLIAASSALVVFWFETTFTIIHIILALFLTKYYGMIGYAWAIIIGRGSRLVAGAILSVLFVNKCETSG